VKDSTVQLGILSIVGVVAVVGLIVLLSGSTASPAATTQPKVQSPNTVSDGNTAGNAYREIGPVDPTVSLDVDIKDATLGREGAVYNATNLPEVQFDPDITLETCFYRCTTQRIDSELVDFAWDISGEANGALAMKQNKPGTLSFTDIDSRELVIGSRQVAQVELTVEGVGGQASDTADIAIPEQTVYYG
jgi:hypothetical protein